MGVTGTGQPYVNPGDIIQRRWQTPADADRVTLVDENGNLINESHPLPTSATIELSGVNIEAVAIKDGTTDSQRAAVDSDGSLHVKIQEVEPLSATTVNPSYIYTWTGNNLTKIRKTIGSNSWEKTLSYTNNNLTSVSGWVSV